MDKEPIVAACLLGFLVLVAVTLGAYNFGYGSRGETVERQCLLSGSFEANGTKFKCERA